MPDEFNPYKVLQVDPEADQEVIQAAYRRLAQKYHPDVAPGPEAAARMVAINRAWEALGDPARRAEHDRAVAAAASRAGAAQAGHDPAAWTGTARTAPAAERPSAGSPAATGSAGSARSAGHAPRPVEEMPHDWTSGRSATGSAYDPGSMRTPDGHGAAGPPPGHPSGSILNFGRYAGWSLGEIARRDLEYLEWLDRTPIGRPYRDEIDTLLRRTGRRRTAESQGADRRGLFRRR